RRRHTRCLSDWSSDVCSSDLHTPLALGLRDGWISKAEAKGKRCVIATGAGQEIDFGAFDDEDGDGYPDLNPVFYPMFVDHDGKQIGRAACRGGVRVWRGRVVW